MNGKTARTNLDRKDNSIGYTVENCVVCCPACNCTKGTRFSYEQYMQLARVIRTFKIKSVRYGIARDKKRAYERRSARFKKPKLVPDEVAA